MGYRFVTGEDFPQYTEYLRKQGLDVTSVHFDKINEETTIENFKGYDGVIACTEPYNKKVIEGLKDSLKIICRVGIGYDSVDIGYAAECGICCTNTPGMMSAGVAETSLLLMLECTRKFYRHYNNLANGVWNKGPMLHELEGKTVGILGFGNNGKRLAQYLTGFRCRVLAFDVNFDKAAGEEFNVTEADTDTILAESEFVCINVPLMDATRGMVNKEFLSKMKKTAFLINTARGGVVDEPALIEALKNNTIAGAGLDVFAKEPIDPDNELLKLENVFCTPHIATNTHESIFNAYDFIKGQLYEFMDGRTPKGCLNPTYKDNIKE